MKKVILQGHLGDRYGSEWKMKANTFGEIFSCIDANYPGFRQDLIDIAEAGGDLDISVAGVDIDVEEMFYPIDNEEIIIITPIPTGAKSGGAKILAAVALVALAFIAAPVAGTFAAMFGIGQAATVGWTAIALLATFGLAAGLAMAGLEQIMTPDPSVDGDERDYLFTQAENTILRGTPVPVLFGEMIVGGIVISNGIKSGIFSGDTGRSGHSTSGSYGGTGAASGVGSESDQVSIAPGGSETTIDELHNSLITGNGGYVTTQTVIDQIQEQARITGAAWTGANIDPFDIIPGTTFGTNGSGVLFDDIATQLSMEVENVDLSQQSMMINMSLGD
jgi:predicted phage tail protein